MDHQKDELNYQILKWTYGLVPIAAGADKFLNLLTDWSAYISPLALNFLPVSPKLFMMLVGLIEIAVGLAVLSKYTHLASLVASVWLVLIAVNLATAGFIDIAVRDIVMAIGAVVLHNLAVERAKDHSGVQKVSYATRRAA